MPVAPPNEAPCPPPPPARADGAGLVAGQPAQAVVADGELQDAVGGRAAEVGPVRRRGELRGQDPPARAGDDAGSHQQRLPDPLAQPGRSGPQVGGGEPRHHQERLHHLGQEREPDQQAGEHQPPGPPVLDRADQRVGRRGHQQHEQRVRVVEPEHQRRRRGERQYQPGDQASRGPEPALDRGVEQQDRAHALQRLRCQHRPLAEAEYPPGQLHHPQRARRLVHGDEAGLVERAEEERLPALRAGLDRGRVEVVRPAVPAQVPQVEEGGQREQPEQRRASPAGIGLRPAQQAPGPAGAGSPRVPRDGNGCGRAQLVRSP